MTQFEYLILKILRFVKFNLSVHDVGICALFSTSEYYAKKESTIWDMVTRSYDTNIDIFYNLIDALFSDNNKLFKINIIARYQEILHKKWMKYVINS